MNIIAARFAPGDAVFTEKIVDLNVLRWYGSQSQLHGLDWQCKESPMDVVGQGSHTASIHTGDIQQRNIQGSKRFRRIWAYVARAEPLPPGWQSVAAWSFAIANPNRPQVGWLELWQPQEAT